MQVTSYWQTTAVLCFCLPVWQDVGTFGTGKELRRSDLLRGLGALAAVIGAVFATVAILSAAGLRAFTGDFIQLGESFADPGLAVFSRTAEAFG